MNQIMVGKHKLSTLVLVGAAVLFSFVLISKNMMAAEAVQNSSQSITASKTTGFISDKATPKEKPVEKEEKQHPVAAAS
jgi:hypothetical protein